MKIYINNTHKRINNTHKRINLTIEMADYITKGEIKMVKQWMANTKSQLESYINDMIDKAERELQIGITDIYELSATYFDNYQMPVITIIGRGYDRSPDSDLTAIFIEAFTSEGEGTTENRYTRAC